MTISIVAALAAAIVFTGSMVAAAAMDATTMKIRNGLVLLLLLAYPVLAPLAGLSLSEMGISAAAAVAVLVGGFAFFAFGWIGGGDAKLATVTALWLGAGALIPFLVYAALFGGALTLLLLQFRTMLLPASWYAQPWIARLHGRHTGVPYGVAMATAALVAFPGTPWMAAL
ncbi:MAG TPA: prepilin peptidase [Afifellaceae bacterium]|nr:prepilin peptidase [Afifellaceae bacterium]